MKPLTLLFLSICFFASAHGQVINEACLVGTWAVTSAEFTSNDFPKDKQDKQEAVRQALLKARFIFKKNRRFTFDFTYPGMQIKNAHWIFDSSSSTITVREWKDKTVDKAIFMVITIKKEGNNIAFLLQETPIVIEVKKCSPTK